MLSESEYDIRQVGLEVIDHQEGLYNKQLGKEKRRRMATKLAIVAPLVAAGALMSASNTEKGNPGWRLLTDVGAVGVAAICGAIGVNQADERRLEAGLIAERTLPLITELGIDAPSWVNQGLRNRSELLEFQFRKPE